MDLLKELTAWLIFGSLQAKGDTIAVIGSGHDIVYPYENYNLYQNILKEGLVISEYIVGTKPSKSNFPMRNRIVAALSDGVLVIQARKYSGAMITVDFALEYGKNICVVPGNVDDLLFEGSNLLLKEGASLVVNHNDILKDFT